MLWQVGAKGSQQEREKERRRCGKYRRLPHLHFERIEIVILARYAISPHNTYVVFPTVCGLCVSVSFPNATVRVSNLLVCP